VQAQQTIYDGQFDPANHQRVYELYLAAYGDEDLARRAQANAAETYVNQQTAAANRRR
jgi:hypothetical protein